LYVFGRKEVFESSLELRDAFGKLLEREEKLRLVTGELWPTERGVSDEVEGTVMEGVEHFGQYIFEMTKAKVEQMKKGGQMLPPPSKRVKLVDDEEGEDEEEGAGLAMDDPEVEDVDA
jgi:intron-binding protein aquarius